MSAATISTHGSTRSSWPGGSPPFPAGRDAGAPGRQPVSQEPRLHERFPSGQHQRLQLRLFCRPPRHELVELVYGDRIRSHLILPFAPRERGRSPRARDSRANRSSDIAEDTPRIARRDDGGRREPLLPARKRRFPRRLLRGAAMELTIPITRRLPASLPLGLSSAILRSITFVPVGPGRNRLPSVSKNRYESFVASASLRVEPTSARLTPIVRPFANAPAASVGPSTPSVPALSRSTPSTPSRTSAAASANS